MLYVSKGLNLTPEQHKEKKEKRKTPNTLTVTIKKPAPSTLHGEGRTKKEKRLKRLPFSIELFQEMTCKLFFSSFLVFRRVSC
jgi:hypothetical protein